MRPIGVDLFAGAGGMSLGFEQAGFDVLAAVEIDPIHALTHKYNFPKCKVFSQSVVDLSGSDIRRASTIGSRAVDVVFGGAPCQGFSLIGHRALDDPRNQLVLEFVRLVVELDAKAFVFENVKGLTVGRHRAFLDELVEAFDAAGYHVRLPWQVLDAAHYGVPQHRERLILMGTKKGVALPTYPDKKTTPADGKRGVVGVPIGPTCSDALGDLPDADEFPRLLETDAVTAEALPSLSPYALEMRSLSNNAWHFGHHRQWSPSLLTSSARTVHTPISKRRFSETLPGTVEPISRFFKLSADGLSNTLRAGTDGARGAFTSPRPIHYKYARCVTVREMARLHSFPDWFRFHATKWHGARQIGNAVPPALARAVAGQIISALKIEPEASSEVVELGNPAWLTVEMSEAAEHFGVPAPNGKRDRKSGARKRKQQEIEQIRLGLISNG